MVISANWRTSRTYHTCAACMQLVTPGARYVSAFGKAESGDRPSRISLHGSCAGTEVLERAGTDPEFVRAWHEAQAAAAAPAEDRPHA